MNRDSNNQNYRDKIILSSLFFLLAAAGLFFLVIFPAMENIKRIKLDTETQAARVEKDYLAGKNLKQLTENLKIIEPQLSRVDQIFIKKDNSMDFITSLEKIAKKDSVSLEPITSNAFGAENKLTQDYSLIPLQTKTKGYFSDQVRYLSDLEKINYYLDIKTLEISIVDYSETPNKEGNRNVLMQITANTYWQ